MRKLICTVALIFCSSLSIGQSARWDLGGPIAGVTTITQQPSAIGVISDYLIVLAPVTMNWCNYPANSIQGTKCTNFATTYTDLTLTTPCASTQPITLQNSNICQSSSDLLGNLGVNVSPGTYTYTLTSGSTTYGPIVVTVGGTGGGGGGGITGPTPNGGLVQTGMTLGNQICPTGDIQSYNGTAWVCATQSSGGNVSTTPSGPQNIVQPGNPSVSTEFSANNFANIRYVTASWNWSYTDSAGSLGNLATFGSGLTLTLPCTTLAPCPLGIDTASGANHYLYKIEISGTGTPEAALVTGGSCTPGATASCTLTVTTTQNHANGYTIGSASTGIQEAWNDAWVNDSGTAPNANSQTAPYVKLVADTTYNVFGSVYLRGRGGVIDGAGALINCSTRDRCIYIGTTNGQPAVNYHKLYNLSGTSTINVDGSQVSNVTATSGLYTITTAASHNFQVGDSVDCEIYSQTLTAHFVGVAQTPTSGTTLTMQIGALNVSAGAATFGFCNILNTFIEDNSDHVLINALNLFQANPIGLGAFTYGVTDDNDQALIIDGVGNRSSAVIKNSVNWPIGAMVYERNDQGNAGVIYLHNAEFTNVNCVIAGGNGLSIAHSVCQGFPTYGSRYFGGLVGSSYDSVYEESTGATNNALYTQSGAASGVPAQLGILVQGAAGHRITGSFPLQGFVPTFLCPGNSGTGGIRNYFVVPHGSANGGKFGPVLFIGNANNCNGANVNLIWPSIQLRDSFSNSIGTLLWDVLVTTGTATPPNGTSNVLVHNGQQISASCGSNGMCSFADDQTAAGNYAVQSQGFSTMLWFWPATYAINYDTTLNVDLAKDGDYIAAGAGILEVSTVAQKCKSQGQASRRSPAPMTCLAGDENGGSGTIATYLQQKDAAGGSPVATSKGKINLGSAITAPNDLITLQDANFAKTGATAGMRPSNDANDIAIGIDNAGGLNLRSLTDITFNFASIPNGVNYGAILNANGFTAPYFGPTANNLAFVDGVVNTSAHQIADAAENYPTNNGRRSGLIFDPPEYFIQGISPPNWALELELMAGVNNTTTCTSATTPLPCHVTDVPITLSPNSTIVGLLGPVGSGGNMSSGNLFIPGPNYPTAVGIPTLGTITCSGSAGPGGTYNMAVQMVVDLETHPGGSHKPGHSAYVKQTVTCGAGTSTMNIPAPTGGQAGSLTVVDYAIGNSTTGTGADSTYWVQQPGTAVTCGSAGTIDATNDCKISGGASTIALASMQTNTIPMESDNKTGNPVDTSNVMFPMGIGQPISFNISARNFAVACLNGQSNVPFVIFGNASGEEGSGVNNGPVVMYGNCGSNLAGVSGAYVYAYNQSPNSTWAQMQMSGGPTSGSVPNYCFILDGRGGSATWGSAVAATATGASRSLQNVTCTLRGGGTASGGIVAQGFRTRVNVMDSHWECNSSQDCLYATNGARLQVTGGEAFTGGNAAHFSSTAGIGLVTGFCPQGSNTTVQDRCSSTAVAIQDDSTGGGTFKGYVTNWTSGTTLAKFIQLNPMTFANLTSLVTCAAATEGTQGAVIDSTTATWGANIAGTGSNHVLGYCDGTAWTVSAK